MSGIVGLYHTDGGPVAEPLLTRLTRAMACRGPDAERTWVLGPVGFGHTLLETTAAPERERQPLRLGTTWIVADARIDARDDLLADLEACSTGTRDAELILHAYRAWGEDCVAHLVGDFAFAIWDARLGRLFCARDHFGVKPFYYTQKGRAFAFSNTLNCLRLHPMVSDDLNELAVADFLLFELNQDPCTTTFADVRRLPPAHSMTVSAAEGVRLRRYWTLPTDGRYAYRRATDCVERFRELFDASVHDRSGTDRVSVLMSGGLDSPSIAATAKRLAAKNQATPRATPLDIHAHTMVYDRLMPDRERHFSGLAANYLRIPIHYLPVDDYRLFDRWEQPAFPRPEPTPGMLESMERDLFARAACTARVAFSGDGGDAVQCPPAGYLTTLLKRGRLGTVLQSAAHLWRTTHRFPRIGLRYTLRQMLGARAYERPYPRWLNPDLERRLDLRERWRCSQRSTPTENRNHPRHEAYAFLARPYWTFWFEMQDPGATRQPLEIRYPFLDVRLVDFMLGIPPIPWCVEKNILRLAMEGQLPDEVRLRPKSPLVSDGLTERRNQAVAGRALWTLSPPSPDLARFVDVNKLATDLPGAAGALWQALVPLSLDWWLRHFRALPTLQGEVGPNGAKASTSGGGAPRETKRGST